MEGGMEGRRTRSMKMWRYRGRWKHGGGESMEDG